MVEVDTAQYVVAFVQPLKDDIKLLRQETADLEKRLREVEQRLTLLMWVFGSASAITTTAITALLLRHLA